MPTTKQKSAHLCAVISSFPQENSWSALRVAREKAALAGDRFRIGSDLVRMYDEARTYFRKNP